MTLAELMRYWEAGSHLGVTETQDYPTHRRIVLVNQMALLAAALTLFYGLLNIGYDPVSFWPLLVATPPIMAAYGGVIWLNARYRHLTARLLLVVVPATQLAFASWLFSNQAGIQLYFFVLWTSLFLLYAPEERWLSIGAAGAWITLYIWIQLGFDEPHVTLEADAGFLNMVFFINALGAFGLLGVELTLFYLEINRTEELLEREYRRSEELLRNILPASVAERLKDGSQSVADNFENVTLLFADIVGFTRLAGKLPPHELVDLLNMVFSRFDKLAEQYGLEKIKTIGDEYMLAGGIPLPRADHATAVAHVALQMLEVIERLNGQLEHELSLRVGMHSGEVVAGVIGTRKFSYDVWGDTVNIASRMQSQSLPGRIQVTEATYELLADAFELKRRGTLRVRGKGRMPTWFLTGRRRTDEPPLA